MALPLTIDKQSGVPIYVQLGEGIRLLIHQGRLKPGDPMPTVRSMAVDFAVNANTIARVYHDLQTAGLLRLERGVGTFVAGPPSPAVSESDFKLLDKRAVEMVRLGRRAGMTAAELCQLVQSRWQEVDHHAR